MRRNLNPTFRQPFDILAVTNTAWQREKAAGATSSDLFPELAPQVGLEPTTLRLTAECSAIELLRNNWRLPERQFHAKQERFL